MVSGTNSSSEPENSSELRREPQECKQSEEKKSRKRATASRKAASPTYNRKRKRGQIVPPQIIELGDELKALQKLMGIMDDTIVFLEARGEPLVFHKVLTSLEKLCGWEVKISDLAKLRTVYPEAYEYRPAYAYVKGTRVRSVVLGMPRKTSQDLNKNSPEPKTPTRNPAMESQYLSHSNTLSPPTYRCENVAPCTPPPRERRMSFMPSPSLESPKLYMNTVAMKESLKERSETLRQKLLAFAKKSYPHAPDIPQHNMPELLLEDPETQIASPKTPRTPTRRTIPASPLKRKIFTDTLVPTESLTPKTARMKQILERVRSRQQATSSPHSKHSIAQKAILSRLPSIAHALFFLYSSFQKSVLPMETVLKRLEKCLPSSSDSNVRDHIDALVKLSPLWCSIIETDSKLFLKIQIEKKLADVRSELELCVQETLEEKEDALKTP